MQQKPSADPSLVCVPFAALDSQNTDQPSGLGAWLNQTQQITEQHAAAVSILPSTVTSQLVFFLTECEDNFARWTSMLLWDSLAQSFPRASWLSVREWLWSLQKVWQNPFLVNLIAQCRFWPLSHNFFIIVEQQPHAGSDGGKNLTHLFCLLLFKAILFVAFLSSGFPWTSYPFWGRSRPY